MKKYSLLDKNIHNSITREIYRQSSGINLIASENYASKDILESVGSIFANKYAEGYPTKRYYSGCIESDTIETLAINRAKSLFGAEHANVQPHSGANANLAVYQAFLKPGDTILSMSLDHGGHLTHGSSVSNIGQAYNIVSYEVSSEDERIDFDMVRRLAVQHSPKIIIAGASSYPRQIDFERFHRIAKEVNAILMVDMSHISGLIATGVHPSPLPFADIVTSTTHKTLRGPRGGLILCKKKYRKMIDKSVFPGLQGGPLMNNILGKAICFKDAKKKSFKNYQVQVLNNMKELSENLVKGGFKLVSQGTDTHLALIKVNHLGLTGHNCQNSLENINIFVNKNKIPFDTKSAFSASGFRIGTAAVTSLGMKSIEMKVIADLIIRKLIKNESSQKLQNEVKCLLYSYRKKMLTDFY